MGDIDVKIVFTDILTFFSVQTKLIFDKRIVCINVSLKAAQ